MPRFWIAHSWRVISAAQFRWLVVAISVLAFIITYAANRGGRIALRVFVVFCLVLFLNAFWHIAAAVYLRGYAPGVVTAVLVVLPVCGWLLFTRKRIGTEVSQGTSEQLSVPLYFSRSEGLVRVCRCCAQDPSPRR
jgi:hypothetical protein